MPSRGWPSCLSSCMVLTVYNWMPASSAEHIPRRYGLLPVGRKGLSSLVETPELQHTCRLTRRCVCPPLQVRAAPS